MNFSFSQIGLFFMIGMCYPRLNICKAMLFPSSNDETLNRPNLRTLDFLHFIAWGKVYFTISDSEEIATSNCK